MGCVEIMLETLLSLHFYNIWMPGEMWYWSLFYIGVCVCVLATWESKSFICTSQSLLSEDGRLGTLLLHPHAVF